MQLFNSPIVSPGCPGGKMSEEDRRINFKSKFSDEEALMLRSLRFGNHTVTESIQLFNSRERLSKPWFGGVCREIYFGKCNIARNDWNACFSPKKIRKKGEKKREMHCLQKKMIIKKDQVLRRGAATLRRPWHGVRAGGWHRQPDRSRGSLVPPTCLSLPFATTFQPDSFNARPVVPRKVWLSWSRIWTQLLVCFWFFFYSVRSNAVPRVPVCVWITWRSRLCPMKSTPSALWLILQSLKKNKSRILSLSQNK